MILIDALLQLQLKLISCVSFDLYASTSDVCLDLQKEFGHIVTSWCVAHVLDLLMEDLGKMPFFKQAVDEAKVVVKFFKNHKFTKDRLAQISDKRLLLPGETRFATSLIMVGRLLEVEDGITQICATDAFKKWVRGKKYESIGLDVRKTVCRPEWWKKITSLANLSGPIVNALRMADSDIPATGKMYHEMWQLGNRMDKMLEECASSDKAKALSKKEIQEVCEGTPKYLNGPIRLPTKLNSLMQKYIGLPLPFPLHTVAAQLRLN